MGQRRGGLLLFILVVLFAGGLLLSNIPRAYAAINDQIPFQGKVTNPDGTNVADGSYSFVFSIYTVASGGTAMWSESKSLTVAAGLFQTYLGDTTALPASVNFNTASLYLGVKVGTDAEMTPRIALAAVPQAITSDTLDGIDSSGYVQLGQSSSAQTDSSNNSSIFINKTGSGNVLQLQSSAVDVLDVSSAGNLSFGQSAAHTIGILQTSSNAVGQKLTISAGQGGSGASANAGGALALQGGIGGGTNGIGGNVTIAGGAGNGSGAPGSVVISGAANSATMFVVQNAAATITLFAADSTNNRIVIGGAASTTTPTILVFSNKSSGGDPAGVNGAEYYNAASNRFRCFAGGAWTSCDAPLISQRRTGQLLPVGLAATTLTGLGLTVPTVNGTATASNQAEDSYVNWASSTTSGTSGGLTPAVFTSMQMRYTPVLYARVRVDPSVVTTARYWVGLTSTSLAASDGTGQFIGLRFSTNAGDTAWQCASDDGTTASMVTTGVTVTANSYYDIIIDASVSGQITCSVAANGGAYTSVTKTTNLPASTTGLGLEVSVTTLTAAARNIAASYVGLEYQ